MIVRMSAVPPLDYAPRTKRRLSRRILILLMLTISFAISIHYYRQTIYTAFACAYWARQCANFTARDGVITRSPPTCAQRLEEIERRDQFRHGWSYTSKLPQFQIVSQFGPTAFLHERISPSGHRRLVLAELIRSNALHLEKSFIFDVFEPSTLFHPGRRITPNYGLMISELDKPAEIHFGQPDPQDSSHITFSYAVLKVNFDPHAIPEVESRGIIDAWLQDDDTVRVTVRDH